MPTKKRTASAPSASRGSGGTGTKLDPRLFDPMFVAPIDLRPRTRALETGADVYAEMLETICGTTDDSQAVEQYDGTLGVTRAFVDAHQSAVAQVQWNDDLATHYTSPGNVNGVRWGSGTMIGPDLFLTCGHLFDQTGNGWTRPKVNGSSATISPQEIATRMHLNFTFQVDASGTLRTEVSFPITELIEYRLGGIDMAVCRIGGRPGDTYGWTAVSTADVAVGSMIAIIGHPAGEPKRVEAGPATGLASGRLSYNDIDTLGGNSGSGILGPAGSVVGVHTNGGCNSSGTGSNFGVPIMTIRSVSPTLQGLGPTSVVLDTIATSPATDVITLARLDSTTLSWRDTSVVADNIVTRPWMDTNRVLDSIVTSPWLDLGGGGPGTGPVADSLQEHIDPGRIDPVVNPVVKPGITPVLRGGGLRPFALTGGHRFPGAEGAGDATASARDEAEAVLVQYEQALAAAQEQLAWLQEEYTQVYAEYVAAFGEPQGGQP